MIRENFSFDEGQKLILEFEELLKANGITVNKGSDLENNYLNVFDILFKFNNKQEIEPDKDYRSLFRDFSGLYDLALKVIKVKNHSDFKQLLPHLSKLNECSVVQNKPSKITDQDANKIVELYFAALCMCFGKNISLDHPDNSQGSNPDILADFDGKVWGFACKTIHTKNSQTIFENIIKAIDQIEKSNAQIGIPVINLKNILDHESIWPPKYFFPSIEKPKSIILENIDAIQASLLNDIKNDELLKVYKNKKSLPGLLFLAQSVSSVFREEFMAPTATRLNLMTLFTFSDLGFEQSVVQILKNLNHYMQLAN